jgi:TonB family protein
MRLPPWAREALDGYRWLWRAHVRWRSGPTWFAAIRFALRAVDDVGRAAVTALEACANPGAYGVPAATTIQGRSNMAIPMSLYVSANERFKAGFDSWLWISMMVAVVIHFATFALWPEMTAIDVSVMRGPETRVLPPPEIDIPQAPQRLTRPALPVMSKIDLGDDATIAPTDFRNNPVGTLPPPPSAPSSNVRSGDGFFPWDVPPSIRNTEEVVRAMRREYPSVLRNAGIGGTVNVTFAIDEDGRVLDAWIEDRSEYEAFNAAALKVADVIDFSPAMNRDRKVAVRVVFPIVFQVTDGR